MSNAIFALPGHGSTSSVGRNSNAIFALPSHRSTSSVGRKSNAIFALPDHGSTSSVGRKSNAIFALPGHGSTSSVGRKSNAIFALPGHGSTSSVGLYYTGSAFIIINPSHHPLVRNEREWYLANASVTPTIENFEDRYGGVWLESANVSATMFSIMEGPSQQHKSCVFDFYKVLAAVNVYKMVQREIQESQYLLARQISSSQASSRMGGSSNSSYRKDDYNIRYDGDDSEDIMRTSAALVNLQLDRKTRNLTNSWRHGGDGSSEEDGRVDHV
ncbi:hypothetical protein Tco_0304417 [Tanacetum coccineum]